MENIFGITSTQAGRSNLGYRVYEADAGIKEVGALLSLWHFLTRNVGITTRLGYAQLLGDAADSPIVDGQGDAGQFSSPFAISYRW
jgi:outer membrane scaffolding protein for murein synthesis (MipA/OmpV family)